MALKLHKNWTSFGLLVTLAVFFGHYLVPEKRVLLHPLETSTPQLYGAITAESGQSSYWLDYEGNEWACDYEPSHSYGCGWDVYWDPLFVDGIDLTNFNAIEISLHYEGTASRIRAYMRNYSPEYATPDNSPSTKFLSMTFPVEEAQAPVRINLSEFSVASWWLREQNVRRQWASPEFDNITKVGIDFVEPGTHRVRIDEIVLLGKWIKTEALLAGILGIWMSIFLLEGLFRFYQLYKKSQHERHLIQRLEDKQQSLEREKLSLKELANKDPLTGIYNRTGFEAYVDHIFGAAGCSSEQGIMLIDIDHFKPLNDTYGHDMGDKVLKAFAAAMAANLRQDDVFARWGGEEFIIICHNKTFHDLYRFADKLREITAQYTFGGERDLHVTISIGITIAHVGEHFDEAFKRADKALYKAKNGGRDRVDHEP